MARPRKPKGWQKLGQEAARHPRAVAYVCGACGSVQYKDPGGH